MYHFLVIDMAHDLLTAAESSYRHSTTNRFSKANKIRFYWINLGDAARSNRHTRFHFIKNEQYSVPASYIAHALQIAFFWQHDAHIHQHCLSDNCGYLALVFGQDAVKRLRIIIWGDDRVFLYIARNAL